MEKWIKHRHWDKAHNCHKCHKAIYLDVTHYHDPYGYALCESCYDFASEQTENEKHEEE